VFYEPKKVVIITKRQVRFRWEKYLGIWTRASLFLFGAGRRHVQDQKNDIIPQVLQNCKCWQKSPFSIRVEYSRGLYCFTTRFLLFHSQCLYVSLLLREHFSGRSLFPSIPFAFYIADHHRSQKSIRPLKLLVGKDIEMNGWTNLFNHSPVFQ
jgi:hypothetical protein